MQDDRIHFMHVVILKLGCWFLC